MGVMRPDVASAIRTLAESRGNPVKGHWNAVVKILGYVLRTKDLRLKMVEVRGKMCAYVDSDHAACRYSR